MRTLALLLVLLAPAVFAQSDAPRASDGRHIRVPDADAMALGRRSLDRPAVQRIGGLTFYATRSDFDAANPGLPVEDFEDVDVAPAAFCASFSPVDAYTDDDCYAPGTLMAPFAIAAVGPTQGEFDAAIALGEGYRVLDFPQPSTVVGANLAVDTTEVRFDPGVYAAGMDVYGYLFKSTVTVRVYDTEANLLGSTTIPEARGGVFFGVRSDGAAIGAIRFAEVDDYVMLDNVAASTVAVGTVAALSFDLRPLVGVLESGTTGTETVTLTNHTGQAIAYDVALAAAPAFITAVTPASGEIPAGGRVALAVTFDAAGRNAGTYVGSLLVETDLEAAPTAFVLPVTLVVTGTAACALTTGAITFDDTIVGTTSSEDVTVENDGTDACALTGASADGPFAVEGFEAAPLAPGASAVITVVYTPTDAGDAAGTLTVTTDGGDLTAALVGSGLDAPTPAVDPAALVFEVGIGETDAQTFTLSNLGGVDAADLAYSIYVAAARPARPANFGGANPEQAASARSNLREAMVPTKGWTTFGLAYADRPPLSHPEIEDPGASRALYRGGGVTLTHSVSQEIIPGYGVACPAPPTSWWRVFDLGAFGIDTELRVTSVDIGIEAATSGATTVNLYTLNGDLASSNLTLVGTAPLDVSAADDLSIATVPIRGTFAADDVVAVEWTAPREGVLFGGNNAGQGGPTYIQADACGAEEPVDLTDIGFGASHWVLNVNGETGPPLVTVAPESGSIAPGTSAEVTVTVDATDFEPGAYAFELLIATNDPNTPIVTVDVRVDVVFVDANEGADTPVVFTLDQGYPNPFTGTATVGFVLPEAADVRLVVYDVLGREVARLVDGPLEAGRHEARFEAEALASGTYLVRLTTEGRPAQTQRVTLL